MTTPDRREQHRWYCTVGCLRRRGHQLRIEPLCRLCLERGLVVPAVVADHIEPHRGDFTSFRLGALRSLCKACHDGLDRTNNPRHPAREDGSPGDPKHHWNARPTRR
jgi:5-methylcytosine-specific restriction endonuclease McrA